MTIREQVEWYLDRILPDMDEAGAEALLCFLSRLCTRDKAKPEAPIYSI